MITFFVFVCFLLLFLFNSDTILPHCVGVFYILICHYSVTLFILNKLFNRVMGNICVGMGIQNHVCNDVESDLHGESA